MSGAGWKRRLAVVLGGVVIGLGGLTGQPAAHAASDGGGQERARSSDYCYQAQPCPDCYEERPCRYCYQAQPCPDCYEEQPCRDCYDDDDKGKDKDKYKDDKGDKDDKGQDKDEYKDDKSKDNGDKGKDTRKDKDEYKDDKGQDKDKDKEGSRLGRLIRGIFD